MSAPPRSSGDRAGAAFATPKAGDLVGPFRVEAELGRGGMGAVYRVRHATTGALYALKLVLPGTAASEGSEGLIRFQREIDALTRLDGHPGIVRIFAAGRHGAAPYYVMELVAGPSLLERLGDAGRLAPDAAARVGLAIAQAVEHAHRRGVLHRDLKPGNVLLDAATGAPRILDFGLAKLAGGESSLTRTGEILGTPGYMAPEQVGSEDARRAPMGPATDVYGIGAVLYHALVGERPFAGRGRFETIAAVLSKHPTPPRDKVPDLSPELEAIVLRALEKDPAARYESAAAFAADLEAWLAGEPTRARPLGRLARFTRRLIPARGPRRAAAVITLAAVAGGLAVGAATAAAAVVSFLSTGASASTEAAREARRRELAAAFQEACAGTTGAIERARGLAAEMLLETPEDATTRERALVLDGLARLARGDGAAIDLASPPWTTHRGAVAVVLLANGQDRQLASFAERTPALLVGFPEAAARVAAVLGEGAVAPTSALARAVVAGLDAGDAEHARLRALIAARRIGDVLERAKRDDGVARRERARRELEEWLGVLRRAIDRDGVAARDVVPASVSKQLEDLLRSFHRQAEEGRLRGIGHAELLAVRVFLAARPRDDPARRELVLSLQKLFYDGKSEIGGAGELTLALGLVLLGEGAAMPFPRDLDVTVADLDLPARIRAAAALPVDERDPLELVVALRALVRRAEEDPDDAPFRSTESAVRDAIVAHWDAVDAVLDRERARGDVPCWALATLAAEVARLERALVREDAPHARARDAIQGTLAKEKLAPGAGAGALAERLFRLALDARFDRAPVWHRGEALASWLEARAFQSIPPAVDDAALPRIDSVLREVATLRDDAARSAGWTFREPEIAFLAARLIAVARGEHGRAAHAAEAASCAPCASALRIADAGAALADRAESEQAAWASDQARQRAHELRAAVLARHAR